MHMNLASNYRQHTTDATVARIVEMARLRHENPRAALMVETLGILSTEAKDQEIGNRISIMQELWKALVTERARRAAENWNYSLNRHINLATLLAVELKAMIARAGELSQEQLTIVTGIADQINDTGKN